jgi:hypothetical protein
MKHALLMLMSAVVLLGLTACANRGMVAGSCANCPETCRPIGACNSGPYLGGMGRGGAARAADPVPPAGVVTYPYYTLRGPRDFLLANPPSIGP